MGLPSTGAKHYPMRYASTSHLTHHMYIIFFSGGTLLRGLISTATIARWCAALLAWQVCMIPTTTTQVLVITS